MGFNSFFAGEFAAFEYFLSSKYIVAEHLFD